MQLTIFGGPGGSYFLSTAKRRSPVASCFATIESLENRRLLSATTLVSTPLISGSSLAADAQVSPAKTSVAPPTAALTAPGILVARPGGELVTVVFAAGSKIDATGLLSSDLQVSGPVAVSVTSVSVTNNEAKSVTAVFTVAAPVGGWSGVDNGLYMLTLSAGAVIDATGQSSVAASGSFQVNVPFPPPSVVLSAPDIVATTSGSESVTVVFAAGSKINASALKSSALQVSGPVDVSVADVTLSNNNTKSVTAVFTVAAPAGGWTGVDNGLYTLSLGANAVTDATGQGSVAATGQLNVNIPVPPPSAVLSAPNIVATTGNSEFVTAVFASERKINASGLQGSALQVSGPNSLTVTSVSVSGNQSRSVTAVFVVAAPADGWTGADNGLYTLSLGAAAVADSAGQGSLGATVSFQVNIPLPPGAIDPTFGKNLPVTVPFAAEAMIAQSDGKLLLAGHVGDPTAGTSQGVIERLNADGSVDTTFGNNGQVLTAAGSNDAFHALLLQSNGYIVAVGSTQDTSGNTEFLVTRYNASGQIDTSFGQSGRALTNFGGTDAVADAAAITASGDIIAAGSSDDEFAYAAYDGSGALDPGFGQSGRQLFALSSGSSSDVIGALAIAPDGDIVAAGTSGAHVVIIQLDASGNADTSFGNNGNGSGIVIVPGLSAPQSGPDVADALAIDSTGRVLVGGQTAAGALGLVRFDSFGTLDTTFGAAGLAVANFDGHADTLLQGAAGQTFAIGTSDANAVAIADFDSTGTLVSAFGASGQTDIAPASGTLSWAAGALQNGNLAVAGSFAPAGAAGSALLHRVVAVAEAAVTGPAPTAPPVFTEPLGLISRKQYRATFTLTDNTRVTLRLTGGSGTASETNGRVSVAITSATRATALSIVTSGGSHSVTLGNVTVSGSLAHLNAPRASLAGTLFATGSIGTLSLAQVSGIIASAGGAIANLNAASFSNATVLSGVNLGADDLLGGSGANADVFSAGTIGSIHVAGTVSNSLIAAGIEPVDGDFLNADDQALGGPASRIGLIVIRGAVDVSTRFVAGAFSHARIPRPTAIATDSHFLTRAV